MSRNYTKTVKGGVSLRSTKVRLPKGNPLGRNRRPQGFVSATSKGAKSYAKENPADFNISFGQTGLTGES